MLVKLTPWHQEGLDKVLAEDGGYAFFMESTSIEYQGPILLTHFTVVIYSCSKLNFSDHSLYAWRHDIQRHWALRDYLWHLAYAKLIIMALSITTLCIECQYAITLCWVSRSFVVRLSVIVLNTVMLNVVAPVCFYHMLCFGTLFCCRKLQVFFFITYGSRKIS